MGENWFSLSFVTSIQKQPPRRPLPVAWYSFIIILGGTKQEHNENGRFIRFLVSKTIFKKWTNKCCFGIFHHRYFLRLTCENHIRGWWINQITVIFAYFFVFWGYILLFTRKSKFRSNKTARKNYDWFRCSKVFSIYQDLDMPQINRILFGIRVADVFRSTKQYKNYYKLLQTVCITKNLLKNCYCYCHW